MNNRFSLAILFITVVATAPVFVSAAPVVPGLHAKHPLNEKQVGELLIGELRCVACHQSDNATRFPMKVAPVLDNVGGRVDPAYLQKFIADPAAVRDGTTMPNLLAGENETSRKAIALAITHFLVSRSEKPIASPAGKAGDAKTGRELFHAVGCVACHSPRDDDRKEVASTVTLSLKHVASKYRVGPLADFLFRPLSVRPSGRMPDMNLTREEAASIAHYLIGREDSKTAAQGLKVDDGLVTKGHQYFKRFNCSACHELKGNDPPLPAKSLDKLNANNGCLSAKPVRSPDFHLSAAQRKAIQKAIVPTDAKASDKDRINASLTRFNCIACHERDDHGGVHATLDKFFQTTEPNLGNDGRVPPPLTLVGAKLNLEWMQKVLFDRESVRPYMLTRMPQFGERNLNHLPALFEKVDHVADVEVENLSREKQKLYRAAGQQLLGDKGLNCITCHNFNEKPSPSFKGIDLMTTRQRLKPGWFNQFMVNPGKYRPGTIMPTYWPDDEAVRKDILDGDTRAQIEAMWYYLSLGHSASDPSGIRRQGTKLILTDTTRTYRGRSGIAGYRGIAVGFPEGLNYAFNAETGTLSGLWRGEFVSVGWSGQGSGGFNPAGRAVSLAQDVSFYRLPNDKADWPVRPRMTKENPVNADPLYPKNRGYRFKGYEFDDKRIPTFMYETGDIKVSDRSTAKRSGEKFILERTLSFAAEKGESIWFRALTGKIDVVSSRTFKTSDLQITIPELKTLVRSPADGSSELLMRIDIPKGQSKVTIKYELLR